MTKDKNDFVERELKDFDTFIGNFWKEYITEDVYLDKDMKILGKDWIREHNKRFLEEIEKGFNKHFKKDYEIREEKAKELLNQFK